ncbi:histamine H3 receptor [Crotalus adamanteus]|uniref:Histamine H3 receptor n=1 Tax=Crotalus adamanteus TaxID=8729 RepID=A0AAW1BSW6_CROAD
MDSSPGALALNGSHSLEGEQGEDLSGQFSTTWTIALAVLMALLIVATVVGNALVMLAFVVDSSLRTQNNYFLLNLAISDFLVDDFSGETQQEEEKKKSFAL